VENPNLEAAAICQESIYLPSKVWYLVFTPNRNRLPWWQKVFVSKHDNVFQHVSIVGPCGDSTIFLDPTPTHIDISYVNEPYPVKELIDIRYPYNTTVRFSHVPETARSLQNAIPSCVSFVKATMGLRCRSVTPYGLFKHVIKNGGEVI